MPTESPNADRASAPASPHARRQRVLARLGSGMGLLGVVVLSLFAVSLPDSLRVWDGLGAYPERTAALPAVVRVLVLEGAQHFAPLLSLLSVVAVLVAVRRRALALVGGPAVGLASAGWLYADLVAYHRFAGQLVFQLGAIGVGVALGVQSNRPTEPFGAHTARRARFVRCADAMAARFTEVQPSGCSP